MDIEGYEFQVLHSIIDSGVRIPLQIALEVHLISMEDNNARARSSAEVFAFMNYLRDFGGYSLIDRHDNPYCSHCTEILLARTNCRKTPPFDIRQSALMCQSHQLLSDALYRFALAGL